MWQIILLLILDVIILYRTGLKNKMQPGLHTSQITKGQWVIYGTMGCGWTRKQIEYMKNNKIPYIFKDCSKNECDKNVEAFPTLVSPSGEEIIGYKEI